MGETLEVREGGRVVAFGLSDLMKYHGPHFPGGVAHAFKVMERAFPLLSPGAPVERREVAIETSFAGPGGRDAFEMVTRAVTRGAYSVDPALGAPWAAERTRAPYFFRLRHRGRAVELMIRPGIVHEEFIDLGRKPDRTPGEEERLTWLKQDMADRLLALDAAEIYDVIAGP